MLDSREPMDGALASRASIHITFCHVDKVGLGEEPFLPRCGGEWLGNIRTDVVQIACTYLRPAEVTSISNNLQLRSAHRVLRSQRHPAELPVIVSDVSYLVLNDQVMLRVYGCLNVVAHYAGSSPACCHGSCVGISHRQLFVRLLFQLLPDLCGLTRAIFSYKQTVFTSKPVGLVRSAVSIRSRYHCTLSSICC